MGFGIEIFDVMMKLTNERRAGKHYFEKVAAQDVHNKTEKASLTESPFFNFKDQMGIGVTTILLCKLNIAWIF